MRDIPTSAMNHIFIIDNSLSMSQKTSHRLSLLEVAKKFAETYIITRMKMPETKGDRYIVFSTDVKKDLQSFAIGQDISNVLDQLRSLTHS
jgi:hypothetical protein